MTPERLQGLLALAPDAVAFEPFRPGVDIHHIARSVDGGPGVALLRYRAGASVPRHRHAGLETILVLEGAQSDDAGRYVAGDFVINRPGSIHRVWSDEGCLVLIHWAAPVEILDEDEQA